MVIALASRDLPAKHKKMATILGSVGAVGLRIVLTFVAVYLLTIPYLKLVGGVLLFWIAVKLIANDEEESQEVAAKSHLWGAVQTIIIADLVMSLDNVVAIAGVANGHMPLIIVGLVTSIPVVIWGSNLIGLLMKKWPVTIVIGAGILGWTAGEMILSDKKIGPVLEHIEGASWGVPFLIALLVIGIGLIISRRRQKKEEAISDTLTGKPGQAVAGKK